MTFKCINGHGGAYLIGDDGTVFNKVKNTFLNPTVGSNGYLHVTLACGKREDKSVHRLVAEYFVENKDNLPVVNHIDENKLNNSADNLEWCTYKYNRNYGTAKDNGKTKVARINADGSRTVYNSLLEAADDLGIKYQGISRVCRGLRKTSGGFKWEYVKGGY